MKASYIAKRNLHLKEQQMEREAYYVRRAQAEMRPKEVLSLIIDGMDQNKTDLPHYCKWSNPSGAGQQKLRTHITGSIVHGRGKYFFLDHKQIPHDTNLSLSCLMKILSKESDNGVLPPTLYVQLDNTTRENKNKYFLGMMAYLVKCSFVKEVYLSFLLVGHTHEDVDQCFSKISQKLKENDAITMTDLENHIIDSQTPRPNVQGVGTVWNISGWLEPHLNQVHNITFPKMYRLQKDTTGHVFIQYKSLSTDEIWHPTPQEKPIEIFKVDENGFQTTPTGYPSVVKPHMDAEDLMVLKRSIKKDFNLAQFTEEKVDWWESFFQQCLTEEQAQRWPIFKETQVPTGRSTLSQKEQELINKYNEKRTAFKEVFTNQNGADRRHYEINDMVILKRSEREVSICQTVGTHSDKIELQLFKRSGSCYINTGKKIIVDIHSCYPSRFKLTNSKNIPNKIKEIISTNEFMII